MGDISLGIRKEVVDRAQNRCEYCCLSQQGQEATFHVDHVIPRAQRGPTDASNLALACVSCSLRKGAKETAVDPVTEAEVPLYNPRTQSWAEHFRWDGETVVALTSIGRTTIRALAMNRPIILAIRREEAVRGRHPPAL